MEIKRSLKKSLMEIGGLAAVVGFLTGVGLCVEYENKKLEGFIKETPGIEYYVGPGDRVEQFYNAEDVSGIPRTSNLTRDVYYQMFNYFNPGKNPDVLQVGEKLILPDVDGNSRVGMGVK